MAEPELVAECVAAMASAVRIPVTVKTRIGIDERDSYEELAHFISAVSAAGCETFIIHARKAWLSGLSPRENREVPPLRYDIAAQIKRDFPRQGIILNGGIQSLDQAKVHLETFDGVMIGRAAYHNPYLLADADRLLFGEADSPLPRRAVVESMLPYIQGELDRGVRLHSMSRHLLGLYHGQPGGRLWRRHLGEAATQRSAGVKELRDVLEQDWLRSA
jgi:tRNA-dihydrouridine synthase A